MFIHLIPILVILVDQLTKIWIKYFYLAEIPSKSIIDNIIIFELAENPGVAFGMFSGYPAIKPFIDILTIAILFFLYTLFYQSIKQNSYEKYPLSLIIGGALGNMIDRFLMYFDFLEYDGVVDFIKLGYQNSYWYVFNVADACITMGVILFFILEITKSLNLKVWKGKS